MGVVAFSCPEVGEVIVDRPLRPGVVESFARKTSVHLSDDRMEAFWVARGWVIHYRVPIELGVPVRNPARVHEFHALNEENR